MNLKIKTIPHQKQRYQTVGDWIVEKGKLKEIRVSRMKNEDYEFLVALHELVEAWICIKRGITQEEVDEFDKKFEEDRAKGLRGDYEEPGNSMDAPYYEEHQFATNVEKLMCERLHIDWEKYDKVVNEL